MKKTLLQITLTLLSLSMIVSMCGCADSENEMKKYTAYAIRVNAYDDESPTPDYSNILKIHQNFGENDIIPEPEEKIKTISFLGKEYTGEYLQANPRYLGGADYEYKTSEGDRFTVTSSGEIVEFESSLSRTFFHNDCLITGEKAEIIKTRVLETTKKWINELYGDDLAYEYDLIFNYTDAQGNTAISENAQWVCIRAKYTPDPDLPYVYRPGGIDIGITNEGDLLFIRASAAIGKLKGKTVPADFTLDTVRKIIKDLVKDKNTSIELACDIDDTANKQVEVFLLSDGRMVCRTYVCVNGNTKNTVEVIIPLE